jgi:hypothetical protein
MLTTVFYGLERFKRLYLGDFCPANGSRAGHVEAYPSPRLASSRTSSCENAERDQSNGRRCNSVHKSHQSCATTLQLGLPARCWPNPMVVNLFSTVRHRTVSILQPEGKLHHQKRRFAYWYRPVVGRAVNGAGLQADFTLGRGTIIPWPTDRIPAARSDECQRHDRVQR